MKKTHFLSLIAAVLVSGQANAGDLAAINTLSQAEFTALSKDLAAVTSTKAIEPAAPLGFFGFDVNASMSMTKVHDQATWAKVSNGGTTNLMQTKLSISKGLPGGLDVGGFVSKTSTAGLSTAGIHAKYALLEGNAILPAIAVRGSHSRMSGVTGMELNNTGFDVLISKGFVGFTPYAGVGTVYSNAKATGQNSESFSQNKVFVGASWNLLLVNLSAEYDRTGSTASVGLKAGVRF